MDLIDILLNTIGDPLIYSLIFFTYAILATIILPIPVEIGLFNPYINPLLLIGILAIAKGFGSILVFKIGTGIRYNIKKWSLNSQIAKKFIHQCEEFVRKYGVYGLFTIMSIPLMVDSIPLYLFSLLNVEKNGKRAITPKKFFVVNIGAGFLRGTIIIVLFYSLGIKLV
jgi:membrane protein YqaA with SNARE-associated domain